LLDYNGSEVVEPVLMLYFLDFFAYRWTIKGWGIDAITPLMEAIQAQANALLSGQDLSISKYWHWRDQGVQSEKYLFGGDGSLRVGKRKIYLKFSEPLGGIGPDGMDKGTAFCEALFFVITDYLYKTQSRQFAEALLIVSKHSSKPFILRCWQGAEQGLSVMNISMADLHAINLVD
jgi:hypothetical protein